MLYFEAIPIFRQKEKKTVSFCFPELFLFFFRTKTRLHPRQREIRKE